MSAPPPTLTPQEHEPPTPARPPHRSGIVDGMSAPPPTLTPQEHELLTAARRGDHAAYRGLVEPRQAELHAHGDGRLGSTHDAEDALQDALLRAWRGLPR